MIKTSQAWMQNKMARWVVLAIALVLGGTTLTTGYADQHPFSGDFKKYKMGKKVFSDYCSRCHGENADGRGKAIPMYVRLRAARPTNFQVKFFSIRPSQYLEKIVRDGGERHSLSQYMPPFGDELNKQQINDVVYFIQNVSLYSANQGSSAVSHKLATGNK